MEHINTNGHEKAPMATRGTPRDPNEYAEKYLSNLNGLIREIAEKRHELDTVAEQRMTSPVASKDAYTRLMATIKDEIKLLEDKRDNLHTQETAH